MNRRPDTARPTDDLRLLRRPPGFPEILVQASAALRYPRFGATLAAGMRRACPSRREVGERPGRRLKLLKRYLRGAHLGWLLARYLLGEARLSRRVHRLAGELYGFWGVAIIAGDHLLDAHLSTREAAREFLEEFLGILHGPLIPRERGPWALPGPEAPSPRQKIPSPAMARLALGLARLLRDRVTALGAALPTSPSWQAAWRGAEARWLSQTRDLLAGQWLSLGQGQLAADHNWRWYVTQVLNQKTLNFFLAPIALLRLTPDAEKNFHLLLKAFLSLNARHLHWQLLDDIGDLVEDSRDGLVTAPGFLLISQGQLAGALLPVLELLDAGGPQDPARSPSLLKEKIIDPVLASMLLREDFAPPDRQHPPAAHQRDCAGQSPEAATVQAREAARRALANLPGEESLSLSHLAGRRRRQQAAYLQAMTEGDGPGAVAAVLASGAPHRLLTAAQDRARLAQVSAGFPAVTDPALLAILRLLEGMMRRAYRRARRVAANFPACKDSPLDHG